MSNENCFSKFRKQIPVLLVGRSLTTAGIYTEISLIFPECTSDEMIVYKNGTGRLRWKHQVRQAQYYLSKQKNVIGLSGNKWTLLESDLKTELEQQEVEQFAKRERIKSGLEMNLEIWVRRPLNLFISTVRELAGIMQPYLTLRY